MDAYALNLAKKLKALLESTITLQAYVLFKICGNCTGLLNRKSYLPGWSHSASI